MPTPSVVTSNSAIGTGLSVSCDQPPNTAAHNLVAFVAASRFSSASPGVSWTTPSGWTAGPTISTDPTSAIASFYRAGSASTSAVTFTVNKSAGELSVVILTVADGSQAGTIDSSSTGSTSNSFLHTLGAITTTKANDLIIGAFAVEDGVPNGLIGIGVSPPLSEIANTGLLSVGITIQATAGSTGAFQGISYRVSDGSHNNQDGCAVGIAIPPYEGPTVPQITYTNGGEKLTQGATVTLTCNPATSPTAAQSTLVYEFGYTTDGGGSWTTLALSSAGVTSKSFTVPSVLTNLFKARVRSKDPAAVLFSLDYSVSLGYSQIIAEVAPPAPVINLPLAGVTYDKTTAATPVLWTYGGGSGNPQTKYTIQWSRDNFASHTATIGPTTSAATSTTIDFSGEADGATISLKVKTTGLTLDSPYSAVRQFIVANPPATPNITAPTNASPPTTSQPTVTFTESSSFVSRRYRVVESGTVVYDTGELNSSNTSFTSPYTFINALTVTIFLSVKAANGLWSAEDSETVTPSFVVPATPTITATANSVGGFIQLQITNSDTPSYNTIRRYIASTSDPASAINVTPHLVKNAVYNDYNIKSGVDYIYIATAWNSNGGKDSSETTATHITLKLAAFHAVSKTNISGNDGGTSVICANVPVNTLMQESSRATVKLLGRSKPQGLASPYTQRRLTENVVIPRGSKAQFDALLAIYNLAQSSQDLIVCARDQAANLVFGKITRFEPVENITDFKVQIEVVETAYSEAI